MAPRSSPWVVLALLLGGCTAPAAETGGPPLGEAWPEADALFRQDPRWRGADNAYSIPLGADRVLWLFGDTFIAQRGEESRSGSTMVSNTLGIQRGLDPTRARMTFHWREAPLEIPRNDLLPPESGLRPGPFLADEPGTRHWPSHGARVGDALLLFWVRIRPVEGGLGFEHNGSRATIVENPDDDPSTWRLRDATLPDRPHLRFGTMGVVVHGDHLLAYSVDEPHHAFLARWPLGDVGAGNMSRPEWWTARGWSGEGEPAIVIDEGAPEASVHHDATLGAWVSVQSTGFGATPLDVRTSPRPEGPWSAPTTFHRPKESGREHVFVYAGKAHPELDGGGLAVTYVANTDEGVFALAADESLYWPRFVRLTYAGPPSGER